MNRFIPLLLMLVLLTGCAAQEPTPTSAEICAEDTQVQVLPFLASVKEARDTEWFCLQEEVTGFLPMENNLVFFSGSENTVLILISPSDGQILSAHETGVALMAKNDTVQLLENGLSYFNRRSGEIVILDSTLQEIRRIPLPEEHTGMPLLSRDGSTLYYCTPAAIRALDTASGISRVLREAAYPVQSLSGLLLEDSVLQVTIAEADGSRHALFLSTESGQLLRDHQGILQPETDGSSYFLCLQEDSRKTLLFGQAGYEPSVLYPRETAEDCFFLGNRVLTAFRQNGILTLDLYDLATGLRTACFAPEGTLLDAAKAGDGRIWLLCRQEDGKTILCRWKPEATQTQDNTVYTAPRYTRDNPDYDGLAACQVYAEDLSRRHGIDVLIYTDATALQPWDYTLEYEHDAAALQRELEGLDTRLSNYPAGFLQTLAEKFSGIKLCIVRQIRGTPESGSVDIAGGIQFWDGYESYIVLAAGHDTERTLYHELCHLIDTVVLTESTAYDQWETLNPSGFQYANAPTHSMAADDWRQAGWESFLDDYSLGYPKEDRARIMEYAMTAGNADRFQSPYLQAKLKLLCTGIRDAFDLEDSAEIFLWEQYLQAPLAPGA